LSKLSNTRFLLATESHFSFKNKEKLPLQLGSKTLVFRVALGDKMQNIFEDRKSHEHQLQAGRFLTNENVVIEINIVS
jgi:hypothetical protein